MHGYSKLKHNGYTYGTHYKRKNEVQIWRCALKKLSDPRIGCKGRAATKLINGYTMVCALKSHQHTCANSKDKH